MQARIIRFAMVVSLVAIAVFGLPLAIGAARYYVVDEQSGLEDDAQAAADGVAPLLAAGNVPLNVSPVSADSPGAVYGLDGHKITGDGPDRLAPALAGALNGRVVRASAGGEYVVAVPILVGDRRVGVLRASHEENQAEERTAVTWGVMVVLAAAAVGGSRLVARRLAVRLSAPLEVLAADAARLGDGDFTVSEPVPAGRRDPVPEIAAVHHSLAVTATRLDELLTRERAFSAETSHQLRTPLAGLRLRLEEAASLPPGSPQVAAAVDGALDAADRLDRTVEELLRLAREPAGTPPEELDVQDLVERVAAEVRADGVPDGRSIAAAAEDPDLRARASTAAVRQILAVLMENALTHGSGQVTVTVRDAGPAVAVDVADEGSLAEDETALFANRSGDSDGHGIGLALARRLAEAQGGRLRLRSSAPTTVTLLLPASEVADEDPGEGTIVGA
ncbi:HAMP domain-containing histidine kinase [Actinomycetospora endophytica]|uniref:histidine kinase n=1 Tax=Actinomycetospora endophytica TaxID=2291215 RepID=A0ABS8PBP4_9PSEU|nr:HAMP domain-containing sensor histidine kinase [Actinomycetospora endophytica]MCD2195574.1 HAMP domain-containing histidine kinase [Actinomycetospora endophytica]